MSKINRINQAVELAFEEYQKEFGVGAKLEEGEVFVTVFNDCSLVIGLKDHTLDVQFHLGEAFRVDFNLMDGEEDEQS